MKRLIIVVIILLIMIPITSCSKQELIKLNLSDQIITIAELMDKDLEIDYENAVVEPMLFTNEDEHAKFEKQFFKDYAMKDFEYQKYDLLIINAGKINPEGDTLYRVENIIKLKDNVKITLKPYGKVTSKKSSQDAVIENIVYLRLIKGVISPNSNFEISKR